MRIRQGFETLGDRGLPVPRGELRPIRGDVVEGQLRRVREEGAHELRHDRDEMAAGDDLAAVLDAGADVALDVAGEQVGEAATGGARDRTEEGLTGRPAEVDRGAGDTGSLRDRAHRDALQPDLGQDLDGRSKDRPIGLGIARATGRAVVRRRSAVVHRGCFVIGHVATVSQNLSISILDALYRNMLRCAGCDAR